MELGLLSSQCVVCLEFWKVVMINRKCVLIYSRRLQLITKCRDGSTLTTSEPNLGYSLMDIERCSISNFTIEPLQPSPPQYKLDDHLSGFLQDRDRSQLYYCDPKLQHIFICRRILSLLDGSNAFDLQPQQVPPPKNLSSHFFNFDVLVMTSALAANIFLQLLFCQNLSFLSLPLLYRSRLDLQGTPFPSSSN